MRNSPCGRPQPSAGSVRRSVPQTFTKCHKPISKPRSDTLWIGMAGCEGIWNMQHASIFHNIFLWECQITRRSRIAMQSHSSSAIAQDHRVPNCPKSPGKMTEGKHYNLFESCKLKCGICFLLKTGPENMWHCTESNMDLAYRKTGDLRQFNDET